jgi:putative acetyltransferase
MSMPTHIRRETPEDHKMVRALLLDAFDDDLPARLVELLRASDADAPGLAFVATDGDEIIGYVKLSWVEVDGTEPYHTLNLTPVAIAAPHRGQGHARALIEHALEAAETRTEAPLVFIEGDPRHYHRYGFRRASEAGIERPAPSIPDAAFQFVPLTRYRVTRHRGKATYPPPFHELFTYRDTDRDRP